MLIGSRNLERGKLAAQEVGPQAHELQISASASRRAGRSIGSRGDSYDFPRRVGQRTRAQSPCVRSLRSTILDPLAQYKPVPDRCEHTPEFTKESDKVVLLSRSIYQGGELLEFGARRPSAF